MPLERGPGCEALAGSPQAAAATADPMVTILGIANIWVGVKMLRKTIKKNLGESWLIMVNHQFPP